MHDRKRKLGQARRFPRGQGKKAGLLIPGIRGVSVEFVHGLCNIRDRGERDGQAEKGDEAMKAPADPSQSGAAMPWARYSLAGETTANAASGMASSRTRYEAKARMLCLAYRLIFSPGGRA